MALLKDLLVTGDATFVNPINGDLNGSADKVDGYHVVEISTSAFNNLSPKDSNTIYLITS